MSNSRPSDEKTILNSQQVSKGLVTEDGVTLQELAVHPTTIGILEFATGIGSAAFDKPSTLILSGGRLTQALFKGRFIRQLYNEVHKYREQGKIHDDGLDSSHGKTIFIELMRTIDEENIDEKKFDALKAIFLHAVWKDSDDHSQMLAYQYFMVCKRLSSFDILLLKSAYEVYEAKLNRDPNKGISAWEVDMSEKLGVPVELVKQSRLENSGVTENPKSMIFDSEGVTRHCLTPLGIAIGQFMTEKD